VEKREYKTKSGDIRFQPVLTDGDYFEAQSDNLGFCLGCGEYADGCEPDAKQYRCESCGRRMVYGVEELMIMGLVVSV
jgi:hypothetical protein